MGKPASMLLSQLTIILTRECALQSLWDWIYPVILVRILFLKKVITIPTQKFGSELKFDWDRLNGRSVPEAERLAASTSRLP